MGIIKPPADEVVEWFVSRELDNFDYLKEVSEEELDAQIQALVPRPLPFHVPLFKHQKVMFLLGVKYPNFLFFADLGAGKTSLTLNLISYHKQCGNIKKALVLVPQLVHIQNWIDECEKHTPHLKAVPVHGTKKERLALLQKEADVYVLNYAGLQVILDTPNSKSPRKRLILPENVISFGKNFSLIAYDEINKVKNITSLTYKISNRLSKVIPYRYGLTGRPFGRHIEDLWGQFNVIDLGKTLGNNFFFFRSAYFKPQKRPWAVEWKFKTEYTDNLYRQIKNRSIRYHRDECVKLPPLQRTVLRVDFPLETIQYVNEINDEFEYNIKRGNIDKIKASFVKMREIASGFVNFKGEDKKTQTIEFKENPKLELLLDKVSEIPEDAKAIVFHDFIFSGDRISKAFQKEKISHHWLYGGTPNALKLQYLKDFKSNPNAQVLLLNSASGALGLNLQHAQFMFFYESPVDPLIRDQAEGRIYRTGQTKTTWIFDLVVKGSVEEKILSFLKEGKDLLASLIETRGENDGQSDSGL